MHRRTFFQRVLAGLALAPLALKVNAEDAFSPTTNVIPKDKSLWPTIKLGDSFEVKNYTAEYEPAKPKYIVTEHKDHLMVAIGSHLYILPLDGHGSMAHEHRRGKSFLNEQMKIHSTGE